MKFQLWLGAFLIVLRYGIHETRGLSSGSTLSICNGTLKSGNLLYKLGFVKTQSLRTVLDSSFEDSLIQSNPDLMSKYVTSGMLSKVFLSPVIKSNSIQCVSHSTVLKLFYLNTLGTEINVPARLLISRYFSRGHEPYSRPKTLIFLEKVHFWMK